MRTQLGKHTLHKCMGAFQKQKTKTNANTKHIFIFLFLFLKRGGGGGGGTLIHAAKEKVNSFKMWVCV